MKPTTTIKVNMLVSTHLMLNVVSWSPCPFVHSEEQKHAPLLRTALRTLQLNPRSWSVAAGAFLSPCESEKAGKMGIFERVGPVVMVNTAQLWRLESGIDSALGWFLSLVRHDQQRDSLIVQLRHDSTDSSHSLTGCFIISSHRNGIWLLFNLYITIRVGGGKNLIHTA